MELNLEPNRPYVIIGNCCCGKTTLARHIFKTLKLDECNLKFLMSPMEDWNDLCPVKFTDLNNLGNIISDIWSNLDNPSYIIIDDVLNQDVDSKTIKQLELLFQVCKEWNITIIICTQSTNFFTEEMRRLSIPIFMTQSGDTEKLFMNWDIDKKHYDEMRNYFGCYTGISCDDKYLRAKLLIKFI